jgi:hypothetical protein
VAHYRLYFKIKEVLYPLQLQNILLLLEAVVGHLDLVEVAVLEVIEQES